jgi:hypothetical protein
MSKRESRGDVIRANVSHVTGGQIAVGKDITQSQMAGEPAAGVTAADLAALRQELAALQARIQAEAPPEKKGAATERIQELEQAVTASKPDLTTMEYVRNWFLKNVPGLAGAVSSVVVNPIVGKLVEAAGETAVAEFHRRFGGLEE